MFGPLCRPANHELCNPKDKETSTKGMTEEIADLCVPSMYFMYQTMKRNLQSNPLHQTSGDCELSFCSSDVAGAAIVLDSFRFLLYFPVRLYFPLVPFRFKAFIGICIFRKSLSADEHN